MKAKKRRAERDAETDRPALVLVAVCRLSFDDTLSSNVVVRYQILALSRICRANTKEAAKTTFDPPEGGISISSLGEPTGERALIRIERCVELTRGGNQRA